MRIKNSQQCLIPDKASFGNVYIMTHSIFSNVIKIGCTTSDAEEYAKSLSAKSPGDYKLFFSLPCDNPCQIQKQLRRHFDAQQYVNEFYEVAPEIAKNVLKREVMKIPVLSLH
ncbi:GIY-YIG nuclease family protein [Colwellia sp. 12G3]|uniref:GIY-YIG nuclease family protein n=1 Tax=Colwellia sp. 12G3 TaxID=2058299 RepID=UPI000C32CB2B|nr:GIY-YIG nuclease family protein [Colwellia sp. 12G3]PKI14892.1 hypothetical protein CXF71_14145 [Colwellia sp. 12G3]